tara:strand:- start:1091 stop:2419 length:1329 start_codon:yes stop_codon:yes gene_type:complete
MEILDFPDNPRLPLLTGLVSKLSEATDPGDVLRTFGEGWSKFVGRTGYISLSCRGLEPGQYRVTRQILDDDFGQHRITDVWKTYRELPIHTGGLLGDIVRRGRPLIIRDLDITDDPVLGDGLQGYISLAAQPLFDGGKILNWAISLTNDPAIHNEKELEDGLLRANLIGSTVKHVQTARKLREVHQRIKDEVTKIANIQQALLPEKLPSIPGVTIAAEYHTFDQAGGDMYSFHPLGTGLGRTSTTPDGRWAILIGDVSGHGPAAAVVMAMVESMLASYPMTPTTTGQVFDYLNKHLCAKRIYDTFVTAFHALYDTNTRTLTYSRAGHPPALWRKPDSNGHVELEELDAVGGLPLGIMPEETYEDATVTLEPGQTLTLYTDGIPETRSPNGAFFGTTGIVNALRACSGEAGCAVDTVMQHVRKHEAGGRPQDDQTLVVMRVNT